MKLNEQGYPVLSDGLHHKLFGSARRPVPKRNSLEDSRRLLRSFDIPIPVDYPEGLYTGDLPFPGLMGESIEAHFEAMAGEFVDGYKACAELFSKAKLPKVPRYEDFVLQPGWTRYEWEENEAAAGWMLESVPYPEEDAFVFDTETFVRGGAFPVIGTALSSEAAYIWLAEEMCDPNLPVEKWTQHDLIPLGHGKFVVGHNISYDRVRARDGYTLAESEPENFYFDTLSAHIAVSGLAAGQRWLFVLAGKDPENLTHEDRKKLKHRPKWASKGSTNSLVETYNFHVATPREFFGDDVHRMKDADKEIRDAFVKADSIEQLANRRDLLEYAMLDSFYTAELFQELWPKYIDSTPSKVALAGHMFLNGSRIPIPPNWERWLGDVEDVFDSYNQEMSEICQTLIHKCVDEWRDLLDKDIAKVDEWFNGPDKEGILEDLGLSKKKTVKITDVLKALDKQEKGWRKLSDRWAAENPWLRQLDWAPRGYAGKYAYMPQWASKYLADPDEKITTKTKVSHLLLNLKWENSPIINTRDQGWCYHNEDDKLTKIPHPKGTEDNVGVLLSKDFLVDMENGRLSSDLPEAKRALDIANATSYWTSVRKRVRERIYLGVNNPHGQNWYMMMPEITAHGTVTRRTVESLMVTMCSTKKHRIGTELKTRVQCPEGWKIVGADFDGQELQIASIYADAWEGGFVGASPMTHTILSGSKEKGTDAHTKLSKAINTSRDVAKGVGFAMLYGAGVATIANTIKKTYKDRSEAELKAFGRKALAFKKGEKERVKYNDEPDTVYYYRGGTDSGCYNYMEEIALRSKIPTLPCLGTKISTALRPSAVGEDFHTGRINWSIQASGAEMLAVILTATHWLARKFKIPAQFIISIHDEIHWMVPEKYAEVFAVTFQMAHLYSWARFHAGVGIPDVPLSRAFFSSVAIDDRIRKSPDECTVTPSNPGGGEEPDGAEYSMVQMADNGWVKKLKTRIEMIEKGLL
jgi:DNA polymerase gamma 1